MTEKRLALVTGATGGIGRATAIALARTGEYHLALHCNSATEEKLEAVEGEARAALADPAGTRLTWHRADLSQYAEVRRLHGEVVAATGHVDVLFNNAGTTGGASGSRSLADVPIDVFEATWRTNTGSAILLTQLCLPHMEAQGFGRVIFNSSVAGLTGGVVGPHYASSKSAMHGFVHWLASNVAKKGVTVNAVAPALIADTTMVGGGEEAKKLGRDSESRVPGEHIDSYDVVKSRPTSESATIAARALTLTAEIPVGRLGRPEEIAETVLWMIRCGYVTNKVIAVDGGMYPY